MGVCVCVTHQEGHKELVQINHLDAAHIQLNVSISLWRVSVTSALCGCRSQTNGKAENLITHDWDGLKDREGKRYSQPTPVLWARFSALMTDGPADLLVKASGIHIKNNEIPKAGRHVGLRPLHDQQPIDTCGTRERI